MANLRSITKKLQTAIIQAGKLVKINTHQFYSNEQSKMITSYSVVIPKWSKAKQKMVDNEELKTCSAIEVVMFLANMLEGLRNESAT